MKFFALIGAALARECYEAVLPQGARAERGELTTGELKVAFEEFAACAERDAALDVTPLYEAEAKDMKACFKYFVNAMYECTKIQEGHPFCVEGNPNYNPILCAVKINQCCVEELTGISECLDA